MVARLPWAQEVASSNLAGLTITKHRELMEDNTSFNQLSSRSLDLGQRAVSVIVAERDKLSKEDEKSADIIAFNAAIETMAMLMYLVVSTQKGIKERKQSVELLDKIRGEMHSKISEMVSGYVGNSTLMSFKDGE